MTRLPLQRAVMWIVSSIVLVSGSATIGGIYYRQQLIQKQQDPKNNIVAIIQTTPQKESLKTVYLAELLELSLDHPTNLYRFDLNKGREKLLQDPLIKEAKLKKIIPSTIFVDYLIREPIAYLGDRTNTAIDREGFLFPFKPFFTPKKLPEIYLGEGALSTIKLWGSRIEGPNAELAFSVLKFLAANCPSSLLRLDVSKAYAESYGQRQIVLTLEDQVQREIGGEPILYHFPRIVRLSTKNYEQDFARYLILRGYLLEQEFPAAIGTSVVTAPSTVVDMRIPQLAFIE